MSGRDVHVVFGTGQVGRALVAELSRLGRVGVRSLPKSAMRALGLFNPMMRALSEMAYEFDAPFVLDTTKYQATFGNVGTALPTAIAETATWYRSRTSSE